LKNAKKGIKKRRKRGIWIKATQKRKKLAYFAGTSLCVPGEMQTGIVTMLANKKAIFRHSTITNMCKTEEND